MQPILSIIVAFGDLKVPQIEPLLVWIIKLIKVYLK